MKINQAGSNHHSIVFVGAGPGDPDLITVKGKKAVEEADIIVYAGSLVPEAVLKWARPKAEKINSAQLTLDEIAGLIIDGYRAGKRVVRLHSGDPALYGAIQEQIFELENHSIPYAVIPGVTAAFAAAAAMGQEYTIPEISQTLIITRMSGRTSVPDTESLKDLAAHKASLVIYLSISHIDRVAEALKESYGEDAPVIIAYKVSHPEEKIIYTTIKEMAEVVRRKGIKRQALIIAGKILEARRLGITNKSKLYDKDFSHGFRR